MKFASACVSILCVGLLSGCFGATKKTNITFDLRPTASDHSTVVNIMVQKADGAKLDTETDQVANQDFSGLLETVVDKVKEGLPDIGSLIKTKTTSTVETTAPVATVPVTTTTTTTPAVSKLPTESTGTFPPSLDTPVGDVKEID